MDPIAPLITSLHSEGRARVWSLVITVFGDLVQHRGGEIASARLGQLLGRVGVEPGALRTAVSRLVRDGWVESRRKGRASFYRLSQDGLARFAPATSRIYAPPRATPVAEWTVSVTVTQAGGHDVQLHPADDPRSGADLCVTGAVTALSDAYRSTLLEPAHRAALSVLASDLDALRARPDTALDAAAMRMLLIHRWRRIALRFADIHPDLMPKDAPLKDARTAVARIYARLTPMAEAWLDAPGDGFSAMPAASPGATGRFQPRENA